MLNSPYQVYQQSSVQTATGGKLIVMLFEGAIRFTKAGIEGIHERNFEKGNTNLKKAQAIINELIASLDFQYEISNELFRIYEYMVFQLIQSNLKKNAKLAEEVLEHLQGLLETWRQVVKTPAGSVRVETGTI
ncbi:flagellar export chaperone FliS [Paenibacillus gorillae]|uniref:flagellar export chaperone FliS n=1 Tax=Paenibacillus gorillae TaxID=1243662 RepID=UPI0005A9913E|nr:flagellar export chaperone FliS [Paenibacillus gorillae]